MKPGVLYAAEFVPDVRVSEVGPVKRGAHMILDFNDGHAGVRATVGIRSGVEVVNTAGLEPAFLV